MDTNSIEDEKLKIQRYQLYLQMASVLMSGILLYVLISTKKDVQQIEHDLDHDIEE